MIDDNERFIYRCLLLLDSYCVRSNSQVNPIVHGGKKYKIFFFYFFLFRIGLKSNGQTCTSETFFFSRAVIRFVESMDTASMVILIVMRGTMEILTY